MGCWSSDRRRRHASGWSSTAPRPDAEPYDVLYADLDADGDLTEPAERLVGRVEGNDVRFRLPDLTDPATGAVHTNFTVRASGGPDPTVMVSLTWRGRRKMGGGYPARPGGRIPGVRGRPGEGAGDVGTRR